MVDAIIFPDNRHMEVVRFHPYAPAVLTPLPHPSGDTPSTHFCWRLSRLQYHRAAGRNMSIKNSTATIGNRTPGLSVCSAVPQPTAPPRAPML